MIRKLTIYIILGTALFAYMDWAPIHNAWWHNGRWPLPMNFASWAEIRAWAGTILCPPCIALAENYYHALMEVEAGEDEQRDLLIKHAPYSYNPLLPNGPRFWWGQGEGRAWRPVSMIAWHLYWLPCTVLWWWLMGSDLFRGRWPWWIRAIKQRIRRIRRFG